MGKLFDEEERAIIRGLWSTRQYRLLKSYVPSLIKDWIVSLITGAEVVTPPDRAEIVRTRARWRFERSRRG